MNTLRSIQKIRLVNFQRIFQYSITRALVSKYYLTYLLFLNNQSPDDECRFWMDNFDSGTYDRSEIRESRYRYKIWFEGKYPLLAPSDIPKHEFDEYEGESGE
jgi:hypothetical protein